MILNMIRLLLTFIIYCKNMKTKKKLVKGLANSEKNIKIKTLKCTIHVQKSTY